MCYCCLQEHTMVGSADSQDIQLCGMGIQAEHCVINITPEGAVFLNPYKNSRYFSLQRKTCSFNYKQTEMGLNRTKYLV